MARLLMILIAAFGLTFSVGLTTGCETMEGFGEDLEEGGEELSEEAREEQYD